MAGDRVENSVQRRDTWEYKSEEILKNLIYLDLKGRFPKSVKSFNIPRSFVRKGMAVCVGDGIKSQNQKKPENLVEIYEA